MMLFLQPLNWLCIVGLLRETHTLRSLSMKWASKCLWALWMLGAKGSRERESWRSWTIPSWISLSEEPDLLKGQMATMSWVLKVRWCTLEVKWCTHCFPLFSDSSVRSLLLHASLPHSSDLHWFWETTETEHLGWPALLSMGALKSIKGFSFKMGRLELLLESYVS